MQYLKRKARPLIKCFGGKAYTARWIVGLLPEHNTYVEPFGGGINILLNLPRRDVEIVCDTNEELINLYRVLSNQYLYQEFRDIICCSGKKKTGLEYNESVFELAKRLPYIDGVMGAVSYLIKCRFSSNGLGEGFAWSSRQRGGMPGDENAWINLKADLDKLHERLLGVDVRLVNKICTGHNTAIDVINQYAGPDTVIYNDPPYPHRTRTAKDAYDKHEMTDQEHIDLLNCLTNVQAKGVFVSTYKNDLYEGILGPAGWDWTFKDIANHAGRGHSKQRRQEFLWFRI